MSWSIQIVGSRAAVKAALAAETQQVPAGVRAAIIEVCDDPKPYKNGLYVKGYGHNNDGKSCESSIGMLTVEPVNVAVDPS